MNEAWFGGVAEIRLIEGTCGGTRFNGPVIRLTGFDDLYVGPEKEIYRRLGGRGRRLVGEGEFADSSGNVYGIGMTPASKNPEHVKFYAENRELIGRRVDELNRSLASTISEAGGR
jgi:hypothetical protein